jgi:SAM-dependent methyltransferase
MWRLGIKVFAVDLSPTMCRLARVKARRVGAHIRVIRGDMRTFRLPERVDLITCEFDAVNHLAHRSDLAKTAKAVARALRPGGFFFFDVNRRWHLEKNWPGMHWAEESGVVMIMRGSYDRRREKGCLDLEWFVRENTCWRRLREHIEQVWWTDEEIRRSLREAGFDRIQSADARHFLPTARGTRTFYLARLGS